MVSSPTAPRVLLQAMEESKHNHDHDVYDLRIRNQEALRWLHGTHHVDISTTATSSNMAPSATATATGERAPKRRFPSAA